MLHVGGYSVQKGRERKGKWARRTTEPQRINKPAEKIKIVTAVSRISF